MVWYWRKKGAKALLSRAIQFSAVVLTALGALIPVAINLLRDPLKLPGVDTGLWASFFVGLAAALIGVDRAFGYSSGWARYVLTATTIRKSLEEFRMDWLALSAKLAGSPSSHQSAALVARAKDFMVGVQAMVLQETKDWVTEFQNSVAQLDKEIGARLDALKAQVEKASQSHEAMTQPGSIELTVLNSDKADGFSFDVLMEGADGKITEQKITGTKKWVQINLPPGQYKVSIDATAGGKPANTVIAIQVKPQEITKSEVQLPI
jgi:SMODS and SLOG-associating 2TM effector domain 2